MKKRVLVDVKIMCDEPSHLGRWGTIDNRVKGLEEWVKDFRDFIRDHRSQDSVHLHIERDYEDKCSFCGSEWEEDETGTPLCCDKAITEWTENVLATFIDTVREDKNAKNIG